MLDIKENFLLDGMTTFKVGGAAKFFAIVRSEKDTKEALEFAKKNNLKIFILGGGSNVVISDKGFDGLVIKIENRKMETKEDFLDCEAGCILFDVVKGSVENGFSGLEWAAGIPGSLGGAIRGNAGAFNGEMSSNIESVRAMNIKSGEVKEFLKDECKFSYRYSIFKNDPSWIILSAKIGLEKGEKEKSQELIKDILSKRTEKQPQGFASAGSFFQNPVVENGEIMEKFEKDIGSKSHNNKIAAGWLITEVGLRGKKIGGVMISEKHANFLVNTGEAKAEDVVILASYVKQQVRDKLNIQLVEEVQYIGF